MTRKKERRLFLILHAVLLTGILCFPLYRHLVSLLPPILTGCVLHDYLFLYCPVCGGTRAVEALLRLDLFGALSYNLFVTVTLLAAFVLDIAAWVRFFQKKSPLCRIPGWAWVVFASFLGIYWIGRNLLMILFGFDPTGDLMAFWRYFR